MIRVGIVGASGWAGASHLPALTALTGFEVTAVATTSRASAEGVAAAHGVPLAFADAAALAEHPDVDLVVVSVKAPEHAKVIKAALGAGKDVLSEWPLGVDAGEAGELAEAAAAAGVVHAVNLQGVHAPDVRFVADLLAEGAIGTVESVAMVAAGDPLGGVTIRPDLSWSADPAAGATVLTIMAGHFLATLERLAGRFTRVAALLPRRDTVTVEGGPALPSGAPGHVLLHGLLESGATASVAVHGGDRPEPDGFLIKVVGSRGVLTARPVRRGAYMHWTEWEITVAGEPRAVPDSYRNVVAGVPSGPPANVAATYLALERAITEGRPPCPDFHDAARHHRLLAAVERAAATGGTEEVA